MKFIARDFNNSLRHRTPRATVPVQSHPQHYASWRRVPKSAMFLMLNPNRGARSYRRLVSGKGALYTFNSQPRRHVEGSAILKCRCHACFTPKARRHSSGGRVSIGAVLLMSSALFAAQCLVAAHFADSSPGGS